MTSSARGPVVVDASVVAALVLGESRADEAVTLLAGRALVSPTLLRYEVANAARHFARRRPEQVAAVREALALSWRLPFTWVTPDTDSILAVALRTGLTCYDAAYLAVALHAEIPLLTFDKRLTSAYGREAPQ